MQAFTLLLCAGLFGNSLGLLRPQELSIGNIIKVVNLKPDADSSLESNGIIQRGTNSSDKGSGTKLQTQLNSEKTKQETDLSKIELIDKVENITGQSGTLIKNESQIIVANLKKTVGDIAENLELLTSSFVKVLISENIQETKDKLRKTISNEIKSAVASQSNKQIGELIKAISDRVSTMLGILSSADRLQLMKTIGPESMIQILIKISDIETIVGLIENDDGKILEKNHIMQIIEDLVSNVIKQVVAFVGEDSVHKTESIAHAVENGVKEAVGEIKKIISGVNEVEN